MLRLTLKVKVSTLKPSSSLRVFFHSAISVFLFWLMMCNCLAPVFFLVFSFSFSLCQLISFISSNASASVMEDIQLGQITSILPWSNAVDRVEGYSRRLVSRKKMFLTFSFWPLQMSPRKFRQGCKRLTSSVTVKSCQCWLWVVQNRYFSLKYFTKA